MALVRRIFIFLAINVLIVTAVSVVLNLLNVQPYLTAHGLNMSALMTFCLVWGMGGAFISLGLSRLMAKWLMRVKIIDPNTSDAELSHLVNTVYEISQAAGLTVMPQVGIYESPEVNAFATGPSRNRSLVAVSRGLLNRMSQKELEGVIAHEVSHIANGDMVTMTLTQGVVNAFVMFLARVLAFAVSGLGKNRQQSGHSSNGSYYMFVFLFEIAFMFLGWMVIAWFSRFREFRADQGGAALAGKDKMISALKALQLAHTTKRSSQGLLTEQPAFQSMKISSSKRKGMFSLFASHPPLDVRIERLEQLK
jgi:heat shock protein HtpX